MFSTSTIYDFTQLDADTIEASKSALLFESKTIGYLRIMRDNKIYLEGDYKTFEEYCEARMPHFGGYRRINQLLGFCQVQEAAGEYAHLIKNERQARPLLKLVKKPEKLMEAIALVAEQSEPSESNFRAAVNQVIPISRNKKKVQEPLVSQGTKVKVSSHNHYRFESEGTIHSKPSADTLIIEFADDELEAIALQDLEISSQSQREINRTWTQVEHEEAIASLSETHKRELEQLEAQIRARLSAEIQEKALSQSAQELIAAKESAELYKKQNLILQQKIYELESLESLRFANECLTERIRELERALEDKPTLQWKTTFSNQAAKVVNLHQDKLNIKTLAESAPDNLTQSCADELIGLFGMALANIAIALPNPSIEVLRATGEILKCEPSKEAIATQTRVLAAAREIESVLERPTISWLEFWAVAEKYQDIKTSYWFRLSEKQRELVKALKLQYDKSLQTCLKTITHHSIVRVTDPYNFGHLMRGIVTEIEGEVAVVRWTELKGDRNEFMRLQISELEVIDGQ